MSPQKEYSKGWKDCANSILLHYQKMFKNMGADLFEAQETYNKMLDHDHGGHEEGCDCEIDEVDYMRAKAKK